MKAYLHNLPPRTWALLAVPLIALAYPLASLIIPPFIHTVVPEAVRSVLSLL